MEVRIYDEEAKGKSISLDEFMKKIDEEDSKNNFRNWFNNLLPNGFGGYNSYYVLTHPWEFFNECYRQVKWAWQRVFRGWDDRIIWSIDQYIAKMLPQWLEKLKKDKQGIPSCMFKDGDEYTDEKGCVCTHDWAMELREKEYNEILDEISKGFKLYAEDNWFKPDSEEEKQFNKSFDLFKEYFGTLWD